MAHKGAITRIEITLDRLLGVQELYEKDERAKARGALDALEVLDKCPEHLRVFFLILTALLAPAKEQREAFEKALREAQTLLDSGQGLNPFEDHAKAKRYLGIHLLTARRSPKSDVNLGVELLVEAFLFAKSQENSSFLLSIALDLAICHLRLRLPDKARTVLAAVWQEAYLLPGLKSLRIQLLDASLTKRNSKRRMARPAHPYLRTGLAHLESTVSAKTLKRLRLDAWLVHHPLLRPWGVRRIKNWPLEF